MRYSKQRELVLHTVEQLWRRSTGSLSFFPFHDWWMKYSRESNVSVINSALIRLIASLHSVAVRPDHQTKSCNWAGEWL